MVDDEAKPMQTAGFNPLAGLSESHRQQEVVQRKPLIGFVEREVVVGKPFEPLRGFQVPDRPPPP